MEINMFARHLRISRAFVGIAVALAIFGTKARAIEAAELVKLLDGTREYVESNAELSIDQYGWDLPKESLGRIEKLQEIFNSQRPPGGVFSSDAEAVASNQDLLAKLSAELGPCNPVHWEISYLNGMKRFRRTLSKAEIDRQTAAHMMVRAESDWIFTDQTIYKYDSGNKVIEIRPLNPLNDAYPFPVHLLDLSFTPMRFTPETLAALELKSEDGKLTVRQGRSEDPMNLELQWNISGAGLAPVSLKIMNRDGHLRNEQLYGGSTAILGRNDEKFPRGVFVVQIFNQGTGPAVLHFFSIKQLTFGTVEKKAFTLRVPPNAKVLDNTTGTAP